MAGKTTDGTARSKSNEEIECVSDILGGMSKNQMNFGGYAHKTEYWCIEASQYSLQTPYEKLFTTYIDSGSLQKEFFAESFSYHMTGDGSSLQSVEQIFPESLKMADEIVKGLAGGNE